MTTMSDVPIIGYWDQRGLGAPIRLMLEYAGVGYEDRRMIMPKPEWLQKKHSLGFDFPNLPYYQEGELKLTQHMAIMRHLARKFKLEGKTDVECAMVDMVSDQLGDIGANLFGLCFNPNFSQQLLKEWVEARGTFANGESLKSKLDSLERFVKKTGGDWFAGESLTFADFKAWVVLDSHRLLVPGCLDGFDALESFMTKFENLPNIKSYLSDPRYTEFPVTSIRAKYGYFPISK